MFGSKGCIDVESDFPHSAVLSKADRLTREKPHYLFLERYKMSDIEELKAFAEAVAGDGETQVTGNDGLQPVLIGLAALRSLKENRSVAVEEMLA